MNAIWIRRLIWLYFILLLWEGAFRKWILPGQSNLFLVLRDPIVIAIYVLAAKRFPWNSPVVTPILVMALISLGGAALSEGFHLTVATFGLRVNFLHWPLMFVIPCYMNRDHVISMGKWFMIFSIPIAWLMVRQFDANIESSWNVGVGGRLGGQLRAAVGDKVRASGPFSFVSGPILFFPLVAAFVFNAVSYRKQASTPLMLIAMAICILIVPVTISRSLLVAMIITSIFYVLAVVVTPRLFTSGFKMISIGAIIFLVVAGTAVFQESSTYLSARWADASSSGGGVMVNIVDRFIGEVRIPFSYFTDLPFFGYGLGMGTNAGAYMLTGSTAYLLAEGEFARIMFESGPFIGIAVLLLRVATVVLTLRLSWQRMQQSDCLPILLWSACALNILSGQWGTPTAQGFAALGGGLILAACRRAPRHSLVSRMEKLPDVQANGVNDNTVQVARVSSTA
jgi:hypothetical protein